MSSVFISYSRKDQWFAEKIYMELRVKEINAWLDTKCLLPGQDWDNTIKSTIKESLFFIFLISENSNQQEGYLKNELELALSIQNERGTDSIFIIPVRLEKIDPREDRLMRHNFIDWFKSHDKAMGRILTVLGDLVPEPLDLRSPKNYIGKRETIDFEPFSDYAGFIRETLRNYPVSSALINKKDALYFEFKTKMQGVQMAEYLHEKYPDTMILVLQYAYKGFVLYNHHLSIEMFFNGTLETLTIPYSSIMNIYSTMGFKIQWIPEDKR